MMVKVMVNLKVNEAENRIIVFISMHTNQKVETEMVRLVINERKVKKKD